MDINIDRVPVSQLPSRYDLKRSSVYARMSSLGMRPVQVGRRSYVTQEQLNRLDALDEHIKAGGIIAEFVEPMDSIGQATERQVEPKPRSSTKQVDKLVNSLAVPMQSPVEELSARLMFLENAAQHGWLLPTHDLAMVLGFLPEENFSRYGFVFEKRGEEWKVGKQ